MIRLQIFAGACIAFVFPVAAFAATEPAPLATPAATPQPQVIGSVTVTADRHPEAAIRSTRPTYVVTEEQMKARGYHTVGDALTQVPGANVLRYGGIGSQENVLLPGSNETNDVLVLINGFPIQNAYSGSVDLGAISTAGVKRIEIVEGGSAALYGSSASAGVINIVTGADDKPYASVSTGSFADNRLTAADSVQLGSANLHAAFGRETANNAYPYPAASTYGSSGGFPAGTRINAAAQLTTGLVTYSDTLHNSNWKIDGIVDLFSDHNGIPNQLPTTDYTSYQAASTQLLGASIEHDGAQAKTTLTISNSRDTLLYADPNNLSYATLVSSTNVDRTDISLRDLIGSGPSRVLVGADTEQASVAAGSNNAVPPDPTQFATSLAARQSQNAVYAQFEHDIASSGRAYAGLRYEHDSPAGHTVAPSIGAAVPVGSLRVSANALTAFRVPTLTELYYPGYGVATLQPERSRNANFTIEAPSVGGGVSARIFTRAASDLIETDPVLFTAKNIDRARFQGIVLTAATKPFHHMALHASYTDTYRADDITSGSPLRLQYVPQTMVAFTLEREANGNGLTWGLTGNAYSQTLQYGGVVAPAWTALNAYLRVPVSPGAILSFRTDNFGNEAYESNAGYPMPGRSYEVELSTR